MNTIIPAEVVRELRGALYHQLGRAAEDIASAYSEPGHGNPDEWSEPIARFERIRALLDRIGRSARDPERDITVSDHHRQAVAAALSNDLEIEHSMMKEPGDAAAGQRERARARALMIEAFAESVGLDLNAETAEHRIAIPDDFMDLLLECVTGALHDAAEQVEQCGLNHEIYAEPLSEFDTIRAALDAIEWGEREDIDVDAHRHALQVALSDRLATERDLVEDGRQSAAKGHERGEEQRQQAYGYALQIEQFMETAGLEIPKAGEQDA
jgi:hypothetical protein